MSRGAANTQSSAASNSGSLPLGRPERNRFLLFTTLDLIFTEKVLQGHLCQDTLSQQKNERKQGKLFDLYVPVALS